ncbi:hypothetical protein [Sphingomonas oligoaromativorans]|uniref:hypothetical protein n=1 Tax=Sphingomonas oligoaromativorans TaxID=575322 RepID=UPI001ABB6AC2|nr:multimeric flavodoxin WrbA [Sphingomonas oligoaromativorans]
MRRKILAADVLILGTLIWMGSAGSIVKRVMERMDAFLEETDGQGRKPSYGLHIRQAQSSTLNIV